MSAASQFVVFRLGDSRFAVQIAAIREIIRYVDPRSTGSADPATRGVIDLRGEIVPVRDPKVELFLDDAVAMPDAMRRIVVVDAADGPKGLVVDSVDEVVAIDSASLGAAPHNSGEFVTSVATVDGSLVVVLDAVALASSRHGRQASAA